MYCVMLQTTGRRIHIWRSVRGEQIGRVKAKRLHTKMVGVGIEFCISLLGEKPWQCETCPKAFLHKDTYKAHVRRHKGKHALGILPVAISHYRLRFFFLSSLGEKPFKCEYCSKAFPEIWALKKHKRLHTVNIVACSRRPSLTKPFFSFHHISHFSYYLSPFFL